MEIGSEERMIHKARDLSPDQRTAIESLIGQILTEEDDISIKKLAPSSHISPERRKAILAGLEEHFARVDAQRQPVSDEEAEAIVNEALRSTRPNYRPVR